MRPIRRGKLAILIASLLGPSILSVDTAAAKPQLQFPWPPGYSYQITTGNTYGCGTHDGVNNWDLYAIDFALKPEGQPVSAVTDGILVEMNKTTGIGFGWYITLDHTGYFTRYAHLNAFASLAVGDRVRAGERVGESGKTGTEAVHLHFQMGKGTSLNSVASEVPEPMTGIENGVYKSVTDFGNWGNSNCGTANSFFWDSRHPLTDAFLYNSLGGCTRVEHATGSGGWIERACGSNLAGWSVYPGLFNADGLTDLFLYNPTLGTSRVEMALSDGTWSRAADVNWAVGLSVYPGSYNDDGVTDLFVIRDTLVGGTLQGQWFVRFGNGSGGWTCSACGGLWSAGFSGIYPGLFDDASSTVSATDKRTDLFIYRPSDGTSFVEVSNGSGGWSGLGPVSWSVGLRAYPGHYNDDARTDLLVHRDVGSPPTGQWWVRMANGTGGWTCPSGTCSGTWNGGWRLSPGFYDAANALSTRLTDVFQYNPDTWVGTVLRANGSGAWCCADTVNFGANWNVYPGHYNGDQLTDILLHRDVGTPAAGQWAVRLRSYLDTWTCGACSGTWASGWQVYSGFYDGI